MLYSHTIAYSIKKSSAIPAQCYNHIIKPLSWIYNCKQYIKYVIQYFISLLYWYHIQWYSKSARYVYTFILYSFVLVCQSTCNIWLVYPLAIAILPHLYRHFLCKASKKIFWPAWVYESKGLELWMTCK